MCCSSRPDAPRRGAERELGQHQRRDFRFRSSGTTSDEHHLLRLAIDGFPWSSRYSRWQVCSRPARRQSGAWFAAFWGVFLFFYAGSYDYGADVRFSLMSYPPLAVLAGIGMSRLVSRGRWRDPRSGAQRQSGRRARVSVRVVSAVDTGGRGRSLGREGRCRVRREVAATLPANALVLTHNPGMFHLWGVNAAQLSHGHDDANYVTETLPRGMREACTFTGISGATSPIRSSGFLRSRVRLLSRKRISRAPERVITASRSTAIATAAREISRQDGPRYRARRLRRRG